MNLQPLRYLLFVAETGSLTAAARQLRISQPAISMSMRQLEEEWKTTLLLRDRRGVQLTEAGRELVQMAQALFAQLEETEQRIHGLEHEDVGRFVLGCPDVLGAYFLPPLLAQWTREAPGIELSLWNASSPSVLEAILRREVHLGIVVNPTPHPDLVMTPLFTDATDFFVAAAPSSTQQSPPTSLAAGECWRQALQRVRTGPLLLVQDLPQSRLLLQKLDELDALPQRTLACGSYEMIKYFTLADVGVSILPRRVANNGFSTQLQRLHPQLPCVSDTICLAWLHDQHRTSAFRRLQNDLLAEGKRLERETSGLA